MADVIILIDGQNLYYGLKDLKISEWDIIWDKLFNSFLEQGDKLLRTYWFRPQKILDSFYTAYNIRSNICYKRFHNHIQTFHNDHDNLPPNVLQAIENEAHEVENWLRLTKEKFSQSEYKYDQISLDYGNIEVVKTGVVKVDPFKKIMLGEKGVDISLAVKMMALSVQKKCEKIILVSGDYDCINP